MLKKSSLLLFGAHICSCFPKGHNILITCAAFLEILLCKMDILCHKVKKECSFLTLILSFLGFVHHSAIITKYYFAGEKRYNKSQRRLAFIGNTFYTFAIYTIYNSFRKVWSFLMKRTARFSSLFCVHS